MRVALINAPYAAAYGPLKSASGRYFPLGLGYLGAVLRRAGHEVILLDPEARRLPDDALAARLRAFGPLLVGITCATPSFPAARRLAAVARAAVPEAVTILGGVHATALPAAVLAQAPGIDLVGLGEGEETMVDLASRLAQGPLSPDVLRAVPGIAFRDGDAVRVNAMRPWIRDLDSLPFPARDLVDFRDYVPHAHNRRGRRATTAISSRGCPYPCTFCASHVVLGRGFRRHSPEYVVGEIEHLVRTQGVDQIIYNDDAFTTDRARDVAICELILQRNLRISWFCFARADGVTRDLLALMNRAGCYSVGFGIESGDPDVLRAMHKNETLDQMRQAVGWANDLGFKTQCFFVFGSPGETPASAERTVRFAQELNPALAFFNMMVPYPGTEAYRACFGEAGPPLDRVRWEDWVAVGPHAAVQVQGLPPLERVVADANRRFYGRPGQVWRMLKHASNALEVWQLVRGGIALALQILRWRLGTRRPPS
ncbi:MAG: radical SAM protein [Candidatus Coatesbacteria bacterium]